MLRLPPFELERPTTLEEALELLRGPGEVRVVAGGTDLLPNMKHELFTPDRLVSLSAVAELRGVQAPPEGGLRIGATTTLGEVAGHPDVLERAPALAQATSLISGPQLRTTGTLGGNVMLDTRCQWYNQTYFWREALGFCLKKDGTECHVVAGGQRCVAAASNDSAPALMTLSAVLEIAGPRGLREVPLDDFWIADGIVNRHLEPDEILVAVRIPPTAPGHRGAYGKLRDRGSIDFPLLGVAARVDLDADGKVADADLVLVAIAARPVRVRGVDEMLAGEGPDTPGFEAALERVAEHARNRVRPLENIPGDADYRRAMVPVYVRHTLRAAALGEGPVHAI